MNKFSTRPSRQKNAASAAPWKLTQTPQSSRFRSLNVYSDEISLIDANEVPEYSNCYTSVKHFLPFQFD